MHHLPPFAVEEWMDTYETQAKYQLAETCCASISIEELASLSEAPGAKASDILDLSSIQGYGEVTGLKALRENLSRLYSSKAGSPLPADDILITPGAIAANTIVALAMVKAGDHVICHYPTYQQLYDVPRSIGCKVDLWKAKEDRQWQPDFDELEAMVTDETKLIILNNPQNPTGAVVGKTLLAKVVELAESKGIAILSDEVYRPLFHGISPIDREFPPSIVSMGYKNVIVTGSLSKAYSLAGLRVGWIASRNPDFIAACASVRQYTTISVSQLDQSVAAFALSNDTIHSLLGRNIQMAKTNLELLERFIIKHDEFCSWVKPVAGTTAFINFSRDGAPVDAEALCKAVMEKTGVMILPGDKGFGEEYKGYVRIGYVNTTDIVQQGLEELRKFMRKDFDDVPLSR
ncbi:PLP-dependent transferase [Polychaeton citri CBS 116435]|uniref:PLP-dependent transferase n=1 Tax=Polychaeton citri CBS 116435 TaxID=1314669 RepID=A0A9P4ULB4_9PEZI|nr:PLP-dependent transferase [Polychaeton citri CBS 116435]